MKNRAIITTFLHTRPDPQGLPNAMLVRSPSTSSDSEEFTLEPGTYRVNEIPAKALRQFEQLLQAEVTRYNLISPSTEGARAPQQEGHLPPPPSIDAFWGGYVLVTGPLLSLSKSQQPLFDTLLRARLRGLTLRLQFSNVDFDCPSSNSLCAVVRLAMIDALTQHLKAGAIKAGAPTGPLVEGLLANLVAACRTEANGTTVDRAFAQLYARAEHLTAGNPNWIDNLKFVLERRILHHEQLLRTEDLYPGDDLTNWRDAIRDLLKNLVACENNLQGEGVKNMLSLLWGQAYKPPA